MSQQHIEFELEELKEIIKNLHVGQCEGKSDIILVQIIARKISKFYPKALAEHKWLLTVYDDWQGSVQKETNNR